ncbi:hypothetical protein D3C81_1130480 [compost metagenome]
MGGDRRSGCGRWWGGRARACRRLAVDGQGGGFRRVAQALVGAALVADLEAERLPGRVGERHRHVGHAVVHLDVAEVLVVLGLARRQHQLAADQAGRFALYLETVAVQVVAFGVDEAQLHPLVIGLDQTELEGLADRQEVAAVVERRATQQRGRTTVEQPGTGRQGEQQQKQEQQARHRSLSVGNAGMIPEGAGIALWQAVALFCRRPLRPCFIVKRNLQPCERGCQPEFVSR